MARRKQTELGDKVTRDEIIHAAKTVFLEQGFQAAPMRTISKEAGFTSGAIYGYFASKEELFYAITDPVADGLMQILDEVRGEMLALPGKDLIYNMGKVYYPHISRIADHMISHREEMELIVNGSKGTKYEGFLQTIVTRNIDNIDKAVAEVFDAA